MKYAPLAALQLRHPYHRDGRCTDFTLRLGPGTRRVLDGHRLILKERRDGFLLLAPVDGEGTPLIALGAESKLRFELYLRGEDFSRFSDLSELAGLEAPVFSNTDAPAGGALTLSSRSASASEALVSQAPSATETFVLRGRPRDGVKVADLIAGGDPAPSVVAYDPATRLVTLDTSALAAGDSFSLDYPTRASHPSGAFAEVELAGESAAWLGESPALFTITFTPLKLRWVYYLVTDVESGVFAIVDTSGDDDAPVFSDGNRRDLGESPDADDPQAIALAEHYPELRRLRFTSDALLSCSATPRRDLELHLDGQRLPFTLPNPPLANYASRAVVVEQVPQRQESLFRVVKHLTASINANG